MGILLNVNDRGADNNRFYNKLLGESGNNKLPSKLLTKIKEKCTSIAMIADDILLKGESAIKNIDIQIEQLNLLIDDLHKSYSSNSFYNEPFIKSIIAQCKSIISNKIRDDIESNKITIGTTLESISVLKYFNDIIKNNTSKVGDDIEDIFGTNNMEELSDSSEFVSFRKRLFKELGTNENGMLRDSSKLNLEDLFDVAQE